MKNGMETARRKQLSQLQPCEEWQEARVIQEKQKALGLGWSQGEMITMNQNSWKEAVYKS